MPKKPNIVYHVISLEWFRQWQKYVGIEDPRGAQGGGTMGVVIEEEDGEESDMFDFLIPGKVEKKKESQTKNQFKNLNKEVLKTMKKEKEYRKNSFMYFNREQVHPLGNVDLDEYPGPINSPEQLFKLSVTNDSTYSEYLPFVDDIYENIYLKGENEVTENMHYRYMPDHIF